MKMDNIPLMHYATSRVNKNIFASIKMIQSITVMLN